MVNGKALARLGGELYVVVNGTGIVYPTDGEGGSSGTDSNSMFAPTIAGSSAVWDASELTLTLADGFLELEDGNVSLLRVVSGTGSTPGYYEIARKLNSSQIKLTSSPGADASNYVFQVFGPPQFARVIGGSSHTVATANSRLDMYEHDGTTAYPDLGLGLGNNVVGGQTSFFGRKGVVLRRGFALRTAVAATSGQVFFEPV